METLHLDMATAAFLVGTLIPLATAFVTKLRASPGLKAVVTLLLSVIAGTINSIVEAGGEFELRPTVTSVILTWLTAIASYYGLWKPTNAAPKVASIAPASGIGTEVIDTTSKPKRE